MKHALLTLVALLVTSFAVHADTGYESYTTYPDGDGEQLFMYFITTDNTFYNNSQGVPYLWIYNSSTNFTGGTWPGQPMTWVRDLNNNEKLWIWKYSGTFPSNLPSTFIINNNKSPQGDEDPFVNGGVYKQGSGTALYTVTKPAVTYTLTGSNSDIFGSEGVALSSSDNYTWTSSEVALLQGASFTYKVTGSDNSSTTESTYTVTEEGKYTFTFTFDVDNTTVSMTANKTGNYPHVYTLSGNATLFGDSGVTLNDDDNDGTYTYTLSAKQLEAGTYSYNALKDGESSATSSFTITEAGYYDITFSYTPSTSTLTEVVSESPAVTIYVQASSAPYLYAWTGSDTKQNGNWPGAVMGNETTTITGEKWYMASFPGVTDLNIIFNNGNSGNGNKTADITGLNGVNYFTYNGTTGYSNVTNNLSTTYVLTSSQLSENVTLTDDNGYVYSTEMALEADAQLDATVYTVTGPTQTSVAATPVTVTEAGNYTVTYTYDVDANTVTVAAEKIVTHNYTIVLSEGNPLGVTTIALNEENEYSWTANGYVFMAEGASFTYTLQDNGEDVEGQSDTYTAEAAGRYLFAFGFDPEEGTLGFEETPLVYFVRGNLAILNSDVVEGEEANDWEPLESNLMSTTDGETYTLTISDKQLTAGTYYYKGYDSDEIWYPSGDNKTLVIDADGTYDIVYTFTYSTGEITAAATRKDHTYTMGGSSNVFNNSKVTLTAAVDEDGNETGTYSWTSGEVTFNETGTFSYTLYDNDKAKGDAATYYVNEPGVYTFTFTYNSSTDELTVTKTKTADIEVNYYLKHPWGTGNDSDWSWKQLTKGEDGIYYLIAQYGGKSVDYNTQGSDDGKTNVTPTLEGNPQTGNLCYFYFNAETKAVTIKNIQHTVTIAGTKSIFGEEGVTLTVNTEDGTYSWTSADVTFTEAGSFNYTVTVDDTAGSEVTYPVTPGTYSYTFTYDPATGETTVTVTETTWTIVGSNDVVNGSNDWTVQEANKMTTTDGVNYTLTVNGVNLETGNYEYKVLSSKNEWLPSGNNKVINVTEAAVYDITYTFNAETKELNATLSKTEIVYPTYTIASDNTAITGTMETSDGVTYTLKVYNVVLDAETSYNYNLDENTSKTGTITVDETAAYRITYTYNAQSGELTHSLLKTGNISSTLYYMKHKWDGLVMSWQNMEPADNSGDLYYVRARYGGEAVVVWNTTDSEDGNESPATPAIEGSPILGDLCYFYLTPSTGDVRIVKWGHSGNEDWTVAGNWQIVNNINHDYLYTYTGNDMSLDEATGNYVLSVYGKALVAGASYNFNVYKDHSDAEYYSGETITVDTDGDYDITYYFNPTTHEVSYTISEAADEYYIRHSWGSGKDYDWTYKPLTRGSDDIYYIIDAYGGTGINWGATANTWDLNYIAEPQLVNDPQVGDLCIFYVNVKTGAAMIVKISQQTVVTGVDDLKVETQVSSKARKVIENGQVVIIKDGVRYNMMGARLN